MMKIGLAWQAGACLGFLVLGTTAAAGPARPTSHAGVTAAWLVGKWGPAPRAGDDGNNCQIDGVVYFKRDGTYSDGDGRGRYRTDGTHIVYYDRITEDDDGNDTRVNFHHPLVTRVVRLGARSMREEGDVWVRCPLEPGDRL